jgi:CDP-glucose 4,6-dehydratase
MDLRTDFWDGRRVFVTGHTGFKGAWLCLWLRELGARVSGFASAPPTTPNLFECAGVAETVASKIADIRDFPALVAAMQEADPDVVFHLAAQPLVRFSYNDPVGTFGTNVMGTVHVLESLRQLNKHRRKPAAAVVVTSDKCYENTGQSRGYREDDTLGGLDPYSASKGCAELVAGSYVRSYSTGVQPFPLATARAGNVIGGGDWAIDRLVPDAIRAFSCGDTLKLRNPGAVRPWQHVLEPLSAYLLLAQRLLEDPASGTGAWNFGPEPADLRSVGDVATSIAQLWGAGAHWIPERDSSLAEASNLTLDCSKARTTLGWSARLSLDAALEFTVRWYKRHLLDPGDTLRDFTVSQIRAFSEFPPDAR